jgi:hypothetical protein
MSDEKTYDFFCSETGRTSLKESELDQPHKDLLLGELMKAWNDNPKENQHRFMDMLYRQSKENLNSAHLIRVEQMKCETFKSIFDTEKPEQ